MHFLTIQNMSAHHFPYTLCKLFLLNPLLPSSHNQCWQVAWKDLHISANKSYFLCHSVSKNIFCCYIQGPSAYRSNLWQRSCQTPASFWTRYSQAFLGQHNSAMLQHRSWSYPEQAPSSPFPPLKWTNFHDLTTLSSTLCTLHLKKGSVLFCLMFI